MKIRSSLSFLLMLVLSVIVFGQSAFAANRLYDLGRQKFLEGSIAWLSGTIKAACVTSGYTPNTATDEFYSGLTPASNVKGTPQTLGSKTSTNGVANAGNITFSDVPSGQTCTYIVIYLDTAGADTTDPLIALIDTGTNLPIASNGGSITISWDTGANKIFKL